MNDHLWAHIRANNTSGTREYQALVEHLVAQRDSKATSLLFEWMSARVNGDLLYAAGYSLVRERLEQAAQLEREGKYEESAHRFYEALEDAWLIQREAKP